MAKAYRCDRCKEYFDKFAGEVTVSTSPGCFFPAEYDMCQDCLDKLQNFLKMEEEN